MNEQDQKSFTEFDVVLVPGSRKGAAKAAGAGSRDLWQIPRNQIRIIPNFNPRVKSNKRYQANIRELANSMRQNGFYQSEPLEVYVGKDNGLDVYFLTDGHCRLAGYDLAVSEGHELGLLPAVPCSEGTTLEDLTVGFVRHNNTRSELSPYELGIVCKRLDSYNWDRERISEFLDITAGYIESLLLLVAADRRIRELVIQEEVNAGIAIEMIRKHGAKAFDILSAQLEKVRSEGKTKLTRSVLPHVAFKRGVGKAAPDMFQTLRDVRSDPGYASIQPELRVRLEALLGNLDQLEAEVKQADSAPHEETVQQQLAA